MERTNARYLEALPEPVQLVTIDVSFISLRLILPQAGKWLADGGQVIALVKPQFEAGAGQVGKGGVVRDSAVHRRVLTDLLGWAVEQGWRVAGLTCSPVRGPKGNVEFLAWLHRADGRPTAPYGELIEQTLRDAESL
jgi:23S rRNA (cytidine1920-2'-O)/16S rRNA (cytidine1409-2'-O)-methyltransferase